MTPVTNADVNGVETHLLMFRDSQMITGHCETDPDMIASDAGICPQLKNPFVLEYFRIQILIKRPWPCNGGWGHTSYFYGIKTRSTLMTKMKNREPLHLLIGIFASRRYIPLKQQDEKPLNAGWPLHHFLDHWSPSIHAEVKVPLRKHFEIS